MRTQRSRIPIPVVLHCLITASLCTLWITCTLPAPLDDTEIQFDILAGTASGKWIVGDSAEVLVPLYPAEGVDTVAVSMRDMCNGSRTIQIVRPLFRGLRDTLRTGIRLTCSGDVVFTVRVKALGGREYLDSLRVSVAARAGCSWSAASMVASLSEGETFSQDLAEFLLCEVGVGASLSLLQGGPATDRIDSSGSYHFLASFNDAGRDTAKVVIEEGGSRDTLLVLLTIRNVNQPPVFKNDPFAMNVARGATATSPVALVAADSIDGDILTYAIMVNSSTLPIGVTAEIDASRRLRITAPAAADTGTYSLTVSVTDGNGGRDSLRIGIVIFDPTAADRLPPTITPDPANPPNNANVTDTTLSLTFSIEDPSGIQHVVWVRTGHLMDSNTVVEGDSGRYKISWKLREGADTLKIVAYDGSVNRNRAVYTYSVVCRIPPRIVTQPPATVSAVAPARVEVSVQAVGTAPLTYQWYRSGTAVGTGAMLVLDPSTVAHSGSYECEVSNAAGTTRSTTVTITVTATPVAPKILSQPRDTRVIKGDAAVFTVTINADANPSPTYRWYAVGNTTAIDSSGATLTIPGVTYAHEGKQYFVVISNSLGRDTSTIATLGVKDVTKPIIAIVGATDTTILLNTVFTDPGATAQDDRDGNISSKIVKISTVDLAKPGRYTVTYNVKDADSNWAVTKIRNVIVEGWVEVGERFPINEYSMAISPDGVPHIAYTDNNDSGAVKVVKLQNNAWIRVGGLASGKDAKQPVLQFTRKELPSVLHVLADEVLYKDSTGDVYGVVVRKNRGMAWEELRGSLPFRGDPFTRSEFLDMIVTEEDSIFVIAGGLVWKYDNTAWNNWSMIGDSGHGLRFDLMNFGDKKNIAYLPNGELYVAGTDIDRSSSGARKRSGTAWQNVGSSVGTRFRGPFLNLKGTTSNQLFIVTAEGDGPNDPILWRLNGMTWDSVFCPTRDAGDFSLTITAESQPILACTDRGREDKLYIWRQNGSNWVTIPEIGTSPVSQEKAFHPTVVEHQGTRYVVFRSEYPYTLVALKHTKP